MRKPWRFSGDGQRVGGLRYQDRVSGAANLIPLEGVFVQIGLVPNTEWLKGTLELNRFGEILVDAKGATSLPNVFAAGDCTTVPFKQIVIAAGDGAKAALGAFDALMRAPVACLSGRQQLDAQLARAEALGEQQLQVRPEHAQLGGAAALRTSRVQPASSTPPAASAACKALGTANFTVSSRC